MTGPKVNIFLMRYTDVPDAQGAFTRSWTNLKRIRGVLVAPKGEKLRLRDKDTVRISHILFTDYFDDVVPTEKDQFQTQDGRTFDILFVNRPGDTLNMYIFSLLIREKR